MGQQKKKGKESSEEEQEQGQVKEEIALEFCFSPEQWAIMAEQSQNYSREFIRLEKGPVF